MTPEGVFITGERRYYRLLNVQETEGQWLYQPSWMTVVRFG